MNIALAIFIGGGLGSLSRYGITLLGTRLFQTTFPIGTLLANLLSCIILGVIVGVFTEKVNSDSLKALLIIGFCGGFSTFSTFSMETVTLMKSGNFWLAAANVVFSIVAGVSILYYFTQKSS